MSEAVFLTKLCELHTGSSKIDDKPELPRYLLEPLLELFLFYYRANEQDLTNLLTVSYKAINAFRDALPKDVFATETTLLYEERLLSLEQPQSAFAQALKGLPGAPHYPPYYFDFNEPEPRFYDMEPDDPDEKRGWKWDKEFHKDLVSDWKEAKKYHEKKQKDAPPLTAVQQAFVGTPFYPYLHLLPDEVLYRVPLSRKLTHGVRVAHEFVLSPSRSGKTTFLTAQILEDFEKVKRGECSIIAIDSENELIPDLAKLAIFGPGGELEGKLIYLEPMKYPLALNIFDRGDSSELSQVDRQELYRGALTTTQFFINSIGRTEVSGHQDIVLKFAVQALMNLPKATVADLRELLHEGGYARYKEQFRDLDPEVARVLQKDLHGDMKASTSAVRSRVTGITSDPLFRRVFSQKDNRLDFYEELQTPKVVLISTAGLSDATGPFGRFIIAKLYEAVLKRKFIPRASRLPIYCYIDEASHYVPDEPMFANMIDRVAKQGLGLIIATQREAHITDSNVLDALKSVAIQVQTRKPHAIISIDKAEPITVHVPLVDLAKLPQMTEAQQEAIREQMAARFGPVTIPEPEPVKPERPKAEKPKGRRARATEPDEETDAKPWPKKP